MRIEIIERRAQNLDIPRGFWQLTQEGDDFVFVADPLKPSIGRRSPTVRPCLSSQATANARLDGGEAAQFGDAAVGDFSASIHHHHAIDLPFQFRQRVRRQQDRCAFATQIADDLVETLP